MSDDFFNRPIWQQYLICILLPSTLFFVGYQFFIKEIKQQAEQQIALYEEKKVDVELLQTRIERYRSAKNSSLTLVTEHELAKAIVNNQLVLTSFKHEQSDSATYLDVELQGQFADFMRFISNFNDNFYYVDFQNLSISKQDGFLRFRFSLLFKTDVV
jgi:Tfp pilus assembly protein PilO